MDGWLALLIGLHRWSVCIHDRFASVVGLHWWLVCNYDWFAVMIGLHWSSCIDMMRKLYNTIVVHFFYETVHVSMVLSLTVDPTESYLRWPYRWGFQNQINTCMSSHTCHSMLDGSWMVGLHWHWWSFCIDDESAFLIRLHWWLVCMNVWFALFSLKIGLHWQLVCSNNCFASDNWFTLMIGLHRWVVRLMLGLYWCLLSVHLWLLCMLPGLHRRLVCIGDLLSCWFVCISDCFAFLIGLHG